LWRKGKRDHHAEKENEGLGESLLIKPLEGQRKVYTEGKKGKGQGGAWEKNDLKQMKARWARPTNGKEGGTGSGVPEEKGRYEAKEKKGSRAEDGKNFAQNKIV